MYRKTLFVFILGCLLSGCREKFTTGENSFFVHLDDGRPTFISPDSLYSDVSYIPLETTDESLFYTIDKMLCRNDRFYILDIKQASVLIFNQKGNYERKLSRKGKGPGEYLSLDDFFVEDSLLYVLSSGNKKILVYDEDFNCVKDYSIGTHAGNMECVNNRIYIYANFFSREYKNIYIFDKNSGEAVNKHCDYPQKQAGVGFYSSGFARWNDSLFISFPYDYRIYKVDEEECRPYLKIDFDENKMFPKEWKTLSDKERTEKRKQRYADFTELPVGSIDNLYLSEKYVFFTFVYFVTEHKFILNRKTNNRAVGYDGGYTDRFPLDGTRFLTVFNDKVIAWTYPDLILEKIERYDGKDRRLKMLRDTFSQLKYDDNPIVCIYTLKI